MLALRTAEAYTWPIAFTKSSFLNTGWACLFALTASVFGPAQVAAAEGEEHRVDFPFYSVEREWKSTLMLNNNSDQTLPVRITAFDEKGHARELGSLDVLPGAPRWMDLSEVIDQWSSLKTGNIRASYTGPPNRLTGQIWVVNSQKHVSFQSRMSMGMSTHQAAIIPTVNNHGPHALMMSATNLGYTPIHVTVQIKNRIIEFDLTSRAMKSLDEGDLPCAAAPGCIVTVQQTGEPGQLTMMGSIWNERSVSRRSFRFRTLGCPHPVCSRGQASV